jgi:hypothetical protein
MELRFAGYGAEACHCQSHPAGLAILREFKALWDVVGRQGAVIDGLRTGGLGD